MKLFLLLVSLMLLPLLSFGASNIPDSIDVRIKILLNLIEESDSRIKVLLPCISGLLQRMLMRDPSGIAIQFVKRETSVLLK